MRRNPKSSSCEFCCQISRIMWILSSIHTSSPIQSWYVSQASLASSLSTAKINFTKQRRQVSPISSEWVPGCFSILIILPTISAQNASHGGRLLPRHFVNESKIFQRSAQDSPKQSRKWYNLTASVLPGTAPPESQRPTSTMVSSVISRGTSSGSGTGYLSRHATDYSLDYGCFPTNKLYHWLLHFGAVVTGLVDPSFLHSASHLTTAWSFPNIEKYFHFYWRISCFFSWIHLKHGTSIFFLH